MDRLKELLQNLWMRIVGGLKRFENSEIFERIMRRYENLSPRGQNLIRALMKLGALCLMAFVILGGPFMLLSKLSRIRTLEKLESNATVFQAEYDAQTRGYTPPTGWKVIASGSPEELSSSFNEYLANIGVPEEFGSLVVSGDTLNLTLREISIRQATNILFQLEGLYPKVRTQTLNMRPNAGQREIIDMDGTFQFNAAFAGQSAAVAPIDEGIDDSSYVPDTPPPPPSPSRPPGGPSGVGPSGEGNSDFQNDYVPPPPPPPPGDYDEVAPPDIPDDVPPPPPPPGFEEEP